MFGRLILRPELPRLHLAKRTQLHNQRHRVKPQSIGGPSYWSNPSSSSMVQYVDAEQVKEVLGDIGKGVTIIDVRESGKEEGEFGGGHIRGALNAPSGKFKDPEELDKIIKEIPAGTNEVIVHCQLSQIRGPKSARLLAERLAAPEWADHPDKPQIKILARGFEGFYEQYANSSPELFENAN